MNTVAKPIRYSEGQGPNGVCGYLIEGMEECPVVAMERVTVVAPLPAGIIGEGEKVSVAPGGIPDAVNVTDFAVVPFEGVTIKL